MSLLPAFLAFTFITAFTPGPNNILALSTGLKYGLRGGMSVIVGSCTGFLCVMLLCGLLVFSLSTLSPVFMEGMKYLGCLYIIRLAWHTAFSGETEDGVRSGAGFLTGFILQFVNVKIMMYGITAYSSFIFLWDRSWAALFAGMVVLTLIGGAGIVAWAFAGSVLQRFFHRHAAVLNVAMALMLLLCLIPMLS